MTSVAVLPAGLRSRLQARYAVPPRAYHSFAHAARVAALASQLGGSRACVLAAWFHDAIYEPGRPDNEARSADLLRSWLPDDADAAEAARLVRLTATHDPGPDDVDGAILCDADLAVLGAGAAADYEAYRSRVRQEHRHVDDDGWRTGRTAVLQGLLDRPTIFRTPEGRARWESMARHNLAVELASLRT